MGLEKQGAGNGSKKKESSENQNEELGGMKEVQIMGMGEGEKASKPQISFVCVPWLVQKWYFVKK